MINILLIMLFLQDAPSDLMKDVVTPHLKKEYPTLMNAKEPWQKMAVSESSDALLKKLAPKVTFFFAEAGNEYPVARGPIARVILAVSTEDKSVTELCIAISDVDGKEAAKTADVVAFLNKVITADATPAERAAAAARIYPACTHFGFGKGTVEAKEFSVKGTKATLKTNQKQPDTYIVEFDDKGQIKTLTVEDNRMHPICHEHRAAAIAFLKETRPGAAVRHVIYNDFMARELPDHYLYEVIEADEVTGFVLVRKNVKTCAYIDRATLEGLPARETLAPLLRKRND